MNALNRRIAVVQAAYNSMTCVSVVYFVQAFQRFGFDKTQIGIITMLTSIIAASMPVSYTHLIQTVRFA